MMFMLTWCSLRYACLCLVVYVFLLPPAECDDNVLIATEGAAHRCYWCGPRAEQVHRSRRAAPCSTHGQDELTVCDPGYPYCAIVATAPPQTISKICVKEYQDDCYTRYCNTSRLWKVTCPCKGDLCNGPITEREKTALSELLGKINKVRRSTPNFTDPNLIETATSIVLETSISIVDPIEENNVEKDMKVHLRIVNDDLSNDLDNIGSSVSSFTNQYSVENKSPKDIKIIPSENVPTSNNTEATTKIKEPSITIVKPTSMPQIESLQQNITPTTIDNVEKITTTTFMTTQTEPATETIVTTDKTHEISHVHVTTSKPKKVENDSIRLVASIPVLINCIIFYEGFRISSDLFQV